MDMQEVTKIDVLIKNIATKHQVKISEELFLALEMCVNKKVIYQEKNNWADTQLPLLNEIEKILNNHPNQNTDIQLALRALKNLKMYTNYVQNNYSQDRDFWMFENLKWIVKNKANNGKVFIWAHNEHINFKGFGNYSNRKIYNLGKHLKAYYQNDYYAVGFDFEKGTLGGFTQQDQKLKWQLYPINQAFANTFAATLAKAKEEIFFIEITKENTESFKFFNKRQLQLLTGGLGYQPNRNNLYTKKYAEMYDALIFIKVISLSANIFNRE
ncbi:MAG: erythromycin esterase family protein [Flavobacterium sp.]